MFSEQYFHNDVGMSYVCMLDHLWCAVGPLHSQKILNFGVSWGGGAGSTGSATDIYIILNSKEYRSS